MKKAILTFGLFSLVVLTSFTTTETTTQNMVAETGDTGGTNSGQTNSGQTLGGNRKLDMPVSGNKKMSNSTLEFSNNMSFVEMKKKSDI
ncbi:hypothetical protein [Flavobacterium microcysteis]